MNSHPLHLSTGFPPIGSVIRWRQDFNGTSETVTATAESYRPSGAMRVYRLRTSTGEDLTAVIDLDPDSGVLRMVAANDKAAFHVELVGRHG